MVDFPVVGEAQLVADVEAFEDAVNFFGGFFAAFGDALCAGSPDDEIKCDAEAWEEDAGEQPCECCGGMSTLKDEETCDHGDVDHDGEDRDDDAYHNTMLACWRWVCERFGKLMRGDQGVRLFCWVTFAESAMVGEPAVPEAMALLARRFAVPSPSHWMGRCIRGLVRVSTMVEPVMLMKEALLR